MSLSDLAALGSFVSGLAVAVTLIFLLIQMRQTNKNQRSLMQQARTARWVDMLLNRSKPGVTELFSRVWEGDMALDKGEIHAVFASHAATLWSIEDSFLQHKAGLLDQSSWKSELALLRDNLSTPDVRVSWKMGLRSIASDDYREFVDSLMSEIKPQKPLPFATIWSELMEHELAEAV